MAVRSRGRVVYFVQAEDGAIKIGTTARPEKRLAELGAAAGGGLTLLAQSPGGFEEERHLHRMFSGERLRGEWFRPTPDLLSLVESVAGGGALPTSPRRRGGRASPRYAPDALGAYLDGGADAGDLAVALGVTVEAIRSWRSGEEIPRADHATRLQWATHGAVRADGWARPPAGRPQPT